MPSKCNQVGTIHSHYKQGGLRLESLSDSPKTQSKCQVWDSRFSLFFFLMWTIFFEVLNLLQYCFCFMFWFLGHEAYRILAPQPGMEPTHTPHTGRQSLNHWTTSEVPRFSLSPKLVPLATICHSPRLNPQPLLGCVHAYDKGCCC